MTSPLVPALRACRAVVFDTDGVLTDSAPLHAAAWKDAFDACLRARAPGQPPFDAGGEYRRHVDGRPRADGAAAFLTARGVRLPPGDAGDPPGTGTVRAVAARKEEFFTTRLREHGAKAWPGAVRLLHALRAARVPSAAVSASRHARQLLDGAGVRPLLDAVVDGTDAARLGLPGKPDPAILLHAAALLAVPPRRAAVVEDALAGVEAGRRGGFALVVGVARGSADEDGLREHGADLVVADPAALLGEDAGDRGDGGG